MDKLKSLIVEAINESAYGFNLSYEVEKATAIQVVMDKDDFTVVGWSISMIIPNWVKSFNEWNIYISDQGKNCGDSNIVNHQKLRNEGGLKQHVEAGEKHLFDNLADEIKVTNGKVNHNPYLKVQNERKSSIVKTKFDGNTLASAVMASERLRQQQRWERGWQQLVMVSVAAVAAFVLEVFPSVVQR